MSDLLKLAAPFAVALSPIVSIPLSTNFDLPHWPYLLVAVSGMLAYSTMPRADGADDRAGFVWHLAMPLLVALLIVEGLLVFGAPREPVMILLALTVFSLLVMGNALAKTLAVARPPRAISRGLRDGRRRDRRSQPRRDARGGLRVEVRRYGSSLPQALSRHRRLR